MELFRELVTQIAGDGHRVLVFSQFVQVLNLLRRELNSLGLAYEYLDGRTRDREARVKRFQEDERILVFLLSLKAGGTGLNLTGASYVIHFDPWWNPAVESQATDRAYRIGQEKKVFTYHLITKGAIEEKILKLQETKRALVGDLLPVEQALGKQLTHEDLEMLFSFDTEDL